MQLAYEDGLIIRNPCSGIKIGDRNSKTKISLTPAQEAELLDRIKNSSKSKRMYPLIGILLNTGLRISEAAGLTWEDVDIENGFLVINKQVVSLRSDNEQKQRPTVTTPKSNAGIRKIYMTDYVKSLFLMQQEISKETDSDIQIDNYSNFVFTSSRGTTLSVRSVQQALAYISEKKNEGREIVLPRITPHILRHTACTKMIRSGMNIKAVQTLMGHSNADVTLDIYTHIADNQIQDEIVKLQEICES